MLCLERAGSNRCAFSRFDWSFSTVSTVLIDFFNCFNRFDWPFQLYNRSKYRMPYYMHAVHVSHCHLCRSVMLVVLFFFLSLGRVSCTTSWYLIATCLSQGLFLLLDCWVCFFTCTATVCTVSWYAIHQRPLRGNGLSIKKSSVSVSIYLSVCGIRANCTVSYHLIIIIIFLCVC